MTGLVRLELPGDGSSVTAHVARLTIDNPPLNLVTRELLEALDAALATLEAADPGDIRAVVVTGAGERAFSAGSNVKDFENQHGPKGRDRHLLESRVTTRLANLPMPTIAAIEGNALGGGLEIALCCDLRVASERAKLGLPEVRLAVTPGAGGTQRLPRVVGPARARELILVGAILDAQEAGRIGLVNRVVPAGEALAAADLIATDIAARGPLAVREAKRLIATAWDSDIETGIAAEQAATERVFASEDMLEGARSFVEKREPEYRGR